MKPVLDVCCGSKMFWFDKSNPLTIFSDVREVETTLCDERTFVVKPDVINDFKKLDFPDNSFKLVVFDPPHLKTAGPKSWQAIKYGKLSGSWKEDISQAFKECFRVLEHHGVLIFKWNETQIKVAEILDVCPYKPMFGHISGKRANTHWIAFMKSDEMLKEASCQ
jgi:SAM-dependent methyltransferase